MEGKPRQLPVWLLMVSMCIAVASLTFGAITAKATADRIAIGIAAMAIFASGLIWVWFVRMLQKDLGRERELIGTLRSEIQHLLAVLKIAEQKAKEGKGGPYDPRL